MIGFNRRRVMGGSKPYDYEVEYLESDGYAYINTGYIPTFQTKLDIKFMPMSSQGTSYNVYIMGSRIPYGWPDKAFSLLFPAATDSKLVFLARSTNGSVGLSSSVLDKVHTVVMAHNDNIGYIDGSQYNVGYGSDTTPYTIQIRLFRDNPNNDSPTALTAKVRIYYVKLYENNVLSFEAIPVVKNGVGYMYDTVSGRLFGNDGTGSFIIGPRKSDFVDLGLPSGTLWASGNLCKDSQGNYYIGDETEYGCYCSWGNIVGYNTPQEDPYTFSDETYAQTAGASLTASIANNDANHDIAVARLGYDWHLPTISNFEELLNNEYTTQQYTTVGGIRGMLITSLINGNILFLPGAGDRNSTGLYDNGVGFYWSSYYLRDNIAALYKFNNNVNNMQYFRRKCGFSIRPVR